MDLPITLLTPRTTVFRIGRGGFGGYIGGTLRRKGSLLLAAGGMPDHVPLLVSLGEEAAIADTVRDIKSNSSR